MKTIKFYYFLLLTTVMMLGCSKYDDTELRGRVKNLEEWQKSVNSDIASLKSLITALEAKDFITGVTPLTNEAGYVITFVKSGAVTIKHGEKGATPIVGTMKDIIDDKYYWTVDGEPLINAGAKVPVTGEKGADGVNGITPQLRINSTSGEWEVSTDAGTAWTSTGVKAQGDAIFATNGIDNVSDPANVIFTLADGTTKITLPKASVVSVGFDKYDTFYGSTSNNEITLILPSTFKETDYSTIVAKVTNESGIGMDIQTRSTATESIWGVKVTKPTFDNGVFVAGSAKISITPPANIKLSQNTMLEVTITDKDGKLFSIARPVKFFDGQIAECIAGSLSSIVTNSEVTKLAVKGSVDAADFAFIRSLKALEVLDLSLTDITSIGNAALSFENSPNTTLKQIIIPESVTTIGGNAFRNCQALESFDLVNTENLGERAFQDCIKLHSIKLGNKLTAINNSTFYNCVSLTSIDIPSNVTTLGCWIFENCENLETITLHDGLQNLSISTFYSCGIVSILIPSTVTEIPNWAFEQCEKLERISLHNAINRIGLGAFSECRSLKTIKIPTGVTVISELAFRYCMNLQTVTLHEGITEIQKEAFFSCENLPLINFNLLTSLKTLGESAFQSCTSLRIFDLSKTAVEVIPDNLLNNCTKLEHISVSKKLKSIGKWAFSYCPFISIDLPASLTTIGDYAFWECKSLINVFCRSVEGPQFFEHTFNIKTKEGRLLYIPKDSHDKYADLSAYFERIVLLQ